MSNTNQCPEGCWRLCGWLRRPYSSQRPHRRGAWQHHPKNIMRVEIIILNRILKHYILIVIQKHCRSTGSASWEWVRSWPPKLSQTAPSVPRLVCAIRYLSLCWWSSSSSWWASSLYWFIFIRIVICVIFDDHGYIIFTLISFLILAIIFMKNMLFSLAIGCIGSGHSVVTVRSWWGSHFWPKKTLNLEFLRFRSASSKFCNFRRPEKLLPFYWVLSAYLQAALTLWGLASWPADILLRMDTHADADIRIRT